MIKNMNKFIQIWIGWSPCFIEIGLPGEDVCRFVQGAVNLEFVLNYIKGSISCTATPFNESSVIIIWHQLAKSADNLLVWFPF